MILTMAPTIVFAGGSRSNNQVQLQNPRIVSGETTWETCTLRSWLNGFVSGAGNTSTRIAQITAYAEKNGAYCYLYEGNFNSNGAGYYRLRSPDDSSHYAAGVSNNGGVYRLGDRVDYGYYGVRPALHINLQSSNWSYAGKVTAKMSTSRIAGYQIRYSTKASMAGAKIKTIKGYKNTSKKITKLKANKKYYVKVRTYKSHTTLSAMHQNAPRFFS